MKSFLYENGAVEVKIIPAEEIRPPQGLAGAILFGGDRLAVCDEAAVIIRDGRQVAIATISPKGEDGQGPAIVGVWVDPAYRRREFGTRVLLCAVKRSVRGWYGRGWDKVRVDTVTKDGLALVKSLHEDWGKLIDLHDGSGVGLLVL